MSRARDNANLGAQAGSGLDASDITTGVLPVGVTGGSGLNALSASNLSAGIVPDARMPNLTGDITTSEGAVATSITAAAVGTDELANNVVINTSGAITTTGAFTSVGIDDNADAVAITIDSAENVGIQNTNPLNDLHVGATFPLTINGSYPQIHWNAYYASSAYRVVTEGFGANMYFHAGDGRLIYNVGPSSVAAGADYSPVAKFEINKDGDVKVNTGNLVIGTSGKGIDFSATADGGVTTPNELLDDYEEGTFTPTWQTTSVSSSIAYESRAGHYIKVGGLVTCWGNVTTNATTWNAGYVQLGGLPFASDSDEQMRGFVTKALRYGVNQPSSMSFAWTDRCYCFYRDASDGEEQYLMNTDMDAGDNKNLIEYCVSYKAVS